MTAEPVPMTSYAIRVPSREVANRGAASCAYSAETTSKDKVLLAAVSINKFQRRNLRHFGPGTKQGDDYGTPSRSPVIGPDIKCRMKFTVPTG